MVFWGGLLPIPSQLLLDVSTIAGWILANGGAPSSFWNPSHRTRTPLLLASCLLTLLTSGLSKRWTLTIVMVPLWICHVFQRCLASSFPGNSVNANTTTRTPKSIQPSRRPSAAARWAFRAFQVLSFLLIAVGAILSVLFPAVQLPSVTETAPFEVGVLDFYVPVVAPTSNNHTTEDEYHVAARIWYPSALKKERESSRSSFLSINQGRMAYLDPATAVDYCRHSMRFGAPPPLKAYGWILHTWRLITLPVSEHEFAYPTTAISHEDWQKFSPFANSNATTPVGNQRHNNPPLVFYSHGLGGVLQLYSYQAMELAAHGALVVSLTHADGSAPVAVTHPSSTHAEQQQQQPRRIVEYDYDVLQLWFSNRTVEYAQRRRQMTNQRTRELLAVTRFVHERITELRSSVYDDSTSSCDADDEKVPQSHSPINYTTVDHTRAAAVRSLLQPLLRTQPSTVLNDPAADAAETTTTILMGHSFGGATALNAAHRHPQLAQAIIAHEPAIDWLPDDARHSMFPPHRLLGLQRNYSGGTGGIIHQEEKANSFLESLHEHVHMLVMHSNEWMTKNEGQSLLLQEMAQHNRLGRSASTNISRHVAVPGAHHTEFSDTSMLTPLWLARAVGLTGPRNPIDTAREIAEHTRAFVRDVVVG